MQADGAVELACPLGGLAEHGQRSDRPFGVLQLLEQREALAQLPVGLLVMTAGP